MLEKHELRVIFFITCSFFIFFYFCIKIGSFHYPIGTKVYTVDLDTADGLLERADVRMAGIKVGYVEHIELLNLQAAAPYHAYITIRLNKKYKLYTNAQATIKQDGPLGLKYLELFPGDSSHNSIEHNDSITGKSCSNVSFDTLLDQYSQLADAALSIAHHLKKTCSTIEETQALPKLLDDAQTITAQLSLLSHSLYTTLEPYKLHGEQRIDPNVALCFPQIATILNSLENASTTMFETLDATQEITSKIRHGQGTVGQLIQDDFLYDCIKEAICQVHDHYNTICQTELVIDAHSETMHKNSHSYPHRDTKYYFYTKLLPPCDYLYLFEFVVSEKGFVEQHEIHTTYCDAQGCPAQQDTLSLSDADKLKYFYHKKEDHYVRNSYTWGLQIGKKIRNSIARVGFFDGTLGAALDLTLPLSYEHCTWTMSIQLFDFTGWNNKNSHRPHGKWLNDLTLSHNLSFVFGVDDFLSREHARFFFGVGFTFSPY
ncbi:MAG: MlaD family protein [Candidatus Babeliales bacterium]